MPDTCNVPTLAYEKHSTCHQLLFIYHPSRQLHCPYCLERLTNAVLVSPFRQGNSARCAVLLKPSNGTFTGSYKPGDDLHVGLVGIDGRVVSFHQNGLTVQSSGWSESLVILSAADLAVSQKLWLETLTNVQRSSRYWHRLRYDEDNFNCFNLVVVFIKSLFNRLSHSNSAEVSKEQIVETFVKAKVESAWRFCQLYRWCAYGWTVVAMADDMEDETAEDRFQDSADFKRRQLHHFKHVYTDTVVDAEQRNLQIGFENGFDGHIALARRLGKARGALRALLKSGNSAVSEKRLLELDASIKNCCDHLQTGLVSLLPSNDDHSEFGLSFALAHLPNFDQQDMELFGMDAPHSSAAQHKTVKGAWTAKHKECLQTLIEQFQLSAENLIATASQLLAACGMDDCAILQ